MVEEEVAMEEEWMVEGVEVVKAEATMEATETECLCLLVCIGMQEEQHLSIQDASLFGF